jgi:hypothetical protein
LALLCLRSRFFRPRLAMTDPPCSFADQSFMPLAI